MRISTSDFTAKKKGSGSNDIFEKCRNFTRPSDLQSAGLYMYFEVFSDRDGCGPGDVRMGRRKVLMFGSNDYLDLITHPKVKEAAVQALKKYGSGCSGSRLLNGTLDLHVKLESELAAFVHKEAALIFGTGFQANYATLSALTEKGDVMICDHNLHASLVEGALRSPARTMRFRHNDLDHFERCLENCPPEDKIFIVSEGVFSMEGDIADLPGILRLAKPYGARTYVDEAHGIGVLGPTGAGAAEHLGVLDEVDIVMGTFSKSLASVGGFIAAERAVVDYLKHTARPFVFSASLPPASVAAVGAALQIMRRSPSGACTCCASRTCCATSCGHAATRCFPAKRRSSPWCFRTRWNCAASARRSSNRASTSIRYCGRPPPRTYCEFPAPPPTTKRTWSGWSTLWTAWPARWGSNANPSR